ncbi:hypothetical protein CLV88_104253 [Shimia abyssi]|uniref:Pyridoxamine 5'-phosphate oxidase putative domain-containing protein n=1 Tax=Shimia abyssi TaxID=1662395 RepID=A0A2P8FEP2_9RHOB|nr:hypothetical protein CLV88_104253 [Shimia abyssi]
MFMVPGSNTVVRVNGFARVTTDAALGRSFEMNGRNPRSVIVIRIGEIYTQCARALMRAKTWASGDESAGLPSAGEILAAMTDGEEGGRPYDDAWLARAKSTMW